MSNIIELMRNLGKLLRLKRGNRGLRETAKEIGVSSATLSRIERGKLPNILHFVKLCKWLNADPGPILGFRATQPTPILNKEDYEYLEQAVRITVRSALMRIKKEGEEKDADKPQ